MRAGRCVVIFPEGGIRLGRIPCSWKSCFPARGRRDRVAGAGGDPTGDCAGHAQAYNWRNWLPMGRGRFGRETMSATIGHPFCLWSPPGLSNEERRRSARELLRERL